MQESRTENAKRNIFWGVIEKIVLMLLPFVVRTVMIKTIGAEFLGLNSLFSSILSVLSITELGFSSAIAFSMYKPIAENDNHLLCALLNTYKKIYQVVGVIILSAGLLLLPFLSHLISGNPPESINIYILYLIYLANTVIGYFLYSYKGVLFNAHQRSDVTSKRTTVINAGSIIFQLIVLLVFKNYYAYVVVIPLTTVVTNFSNAYLAKKMYPQILCRGNISKEMKGEIKKRVIGLLSYKIYGVIFSSVDTIVISSFLGLLPLAIYSNYYYIQTAITSFLTIITSSITAGIGNKMICCSKEENYSDFKKIVYVNGWIVSWCAVCFFCLYQHFITIWVGEEMLLPFETMILMVLYFFIPRVTTITFTYREAAGLWWEDRYRPLISAVVNLTLNLILVRHIGLNGVVISTLVCSILINIPWGSYILFKKYFKRTVKEYYFRIFFYTLVTAGVATVTYLLLSLLPGQGIGAFAVKCIACSVFPNILFYGVYKRLPEFEYLKRLISGILKKEKDRLKKIVCGEVL